VFVIIFRYNYLWVIDSFHFYSLGSVNRTIELCCDYLITGKCMDRNKDLLQEYCDLYNKRASDENYGSDLELHF